jgi:hypothetical protein
MQKLSYSTAALMEWLNRSPPPNPHTHILVPTLHQLDIKDNAVIMVNFTVCEELDSKHDSVMMVNFTVVGSQG